jgi:hypothetical protein
MGNYSCPTRCCARGAIPEVARVVGARGDLSSHGGSTGSINSHNQHRTACHNERDATVLIAIDSADRARNSKPDTITTFVGCGLAIL